MQAPGQFSFQARRYVMAGVRTIEDTRHANLLLLLGELAQEHGERGAIQRLAETMGRSHSQISQIKTRAAHSRTGKPRNIGSKLARDIEAASGKPPGWMDSAHEAGPSMQQLVAAEVARQIAAGAAQAQPEALIRKRRAGDR
jgi:hypothetical protein